MFQEWYGHRGSSEPASVNIIDSGAQPRLKSSGGLRFGSQHLCAWASRPAKGQAGYWVRELELPLWGSGGITPGIYLKTQRLNHAFWWLLCLLVGSLWREISSFLKTTPKKLGDQYIVGPQPKSWGTSLSWPYVVAPMRWLTWLLVLRNLWWVTLSSSMQLIFVTWRSM